MKRLFYITLILLPLCLTSQNSFELKIKTDLDDSATDIFQCTDGNYIFVGSSTDIINANSRGIIYKISPEGSVVNNIEIAKTDTLVYLDIMDTINGSFVACGRVTEKIQNEDFSSIYLVYFNSMLEILSEKIIPLPPEYTSAFYSMMKSDGDKIYVAGMARHLDYQTYKFDVFLYELSAVGDSVNANFTRREGIQFAEGYLLRPNNEGHYIFSFGNWSYDQGTIVKYDEDLNFIETDTLPLNIWWDNYAMNLPTGNYLVSGRQYFDTSPGISDGEERRSVLYNMQDTNIPTNFYNYHMGTDTLSMPAALRSFDTTNAGKIYFSGTANIEFTYPWQQSPSWIFLSKLDENLEPQWIRFYGGDMFYHIYTVKATQDGGAIMTCRTYDYETQYLEHDIIILKVDENGLIVGAGEEPSGLTMQDAIVYPNPGSEFLTVQSGSQINGALFELFDLSGNLVLSATLDERLETLSTIELSTGTYPYRITFQNKIVGSGKWVKE